MKKIFTLILVAMAAIAANAAVTFHVTPGGDYIPSLYVWNDEGKDVWPGTAMTAGDNGIYVGTTNKTGTVNFIINNGNDGNGNQTVDLSVNVVDGDVVNVVVTPNDGKRTATVEVEGQERESIEKMYVIGDLKEGAWSPSIGVEMVHAEVDNVTKDNEFVCTINLTAGTSYFSFTTKLADSNNWGQINGKGYRYGAMENNTQVVLNDEKTVAEFPLQQADEEASFEVPGGEYSIKVILENGVPSKMQIAKGHNNAVITAVNDVNAVKNVAGVRYYNLQGMQSAEPFSGINIMVTNYTDGTTSTAKVIR